MMTAEQLADVVSRKVKLKRIGQERWAGLCPFHSEKTPSFQVYKGADGAGHYHCKGCHQNGSAKWWLVLMEGKTYREAGGRYDPQLERVRKERTRRLQLLHEFRDRNPDCCIPDEFLLAHSDWLGSGRLKPDTAIPDSAANSSANCTILCMSGNSRWASLSGLSSAQCTK